MDLCQTMLRGLSLSGFRLVGANGLVKKIPDTGFDVTSLSRWVVTMTLTSMEYGYPVPTISGSFATVYCVLSPGTSILLENSTIRGGRTPSVPGTAAPSWDSGVHSSESWSSWSSAEIKVCLDPQNDSVHFYKLICREFAICCFERSAIFSLI